MSLDLNSYKSCYDFKFQIQMGDALARSSFPQMIDDQMSQSAFCCMFDFAAWCVMFNGTLRLSVISQTFSAREKKSTPHSKHPLHNIY